MPPQARRQWSIRRWRRSALAGGLLQACGGSTERALPDCVDPGCADAAQDARTADAETAREAGGATTASDAGRSDAGPTPDPDDAASQAAVEEASAQGDSGRCGACESYTPAESLARLAIAELAELSGLTVSWTNPGILFAHNDRGRSTVYALDQLGALHARLTLAGATVSDPEDLAVGPCPAGTCLYLADIGDNAAARSEYAILRFEEPRVPEAPGETSIDVSFERFRFRYEDGSHNAEGLMVSPAGSIYVVTKLNGPSSVYRLDEPLSTSELNVALKVATLPVPAAGEMPASAAAAHPCGRGFLVRTYDRVHEFRATSDAFESAFVATPRAVATPDEPQSEGISYLPDGRGFVSAGEGAAAPIFATRCQ